MISKGAYLSAAEAVLRRVGRPMHYTSIAQLAIRLRLLTTNSVQPEIAMSTTISADIADNPSTVFKRERPGVYSLREDEKTPSEDSAFLCTALTEKIASLRVVLTAASDLAVVRRSIYLFSRALQLSSPNGPVQFSGEGGSVELDPRQLAGIPPGSIHSANRCIDRCAVTSAPPSRLAGKHSDVTRRALEKLLTSRGWNVRDEAGCAILAASLFVLEKAMNVSGPDGQVTLIGSAGAAPISLIRGRQESCAEQGDPWQAHL